MVVSRDVRFGLHTMSVEMYQNVPAPNSLVATTNLPFDSDSMTSSPCVDRKDFALFIIFWKDHQFKFPIFIVRHIHLIKLRS